MIIQSQVVMNQRAAVMDLHQTKGSKPSLAITGYLETDFFKQPVPSVYTEGFLFLAAQATKCI